MPVQEQPESIFNQLDAFGHKKVVFCSDPDTGLKAIIAIHDTTLGPAFGSTRMWSYKTEADALNDVLRLSKSMTYKCAIAGLNMGGGYSVIIGDSRKDKTEALMRKFGRFIKNLNGEFITSEDVGTNPRDMEYIRMETQHVTGIPESLGGSGDPSPVAAQGVFQGIKACVKEQFGSDSLTGKSVIVQGVGHVGEHLVRLLRDENVKVYVSDIQEERIGQIAKRYGAEAVSNNSIFDIDADIYAPCALGGTINTQTINKLKCSIIAGSANNQLLDEAEHGAMLLEKGILFAPDYVINAGGIINCYSELMSFSKKRTMQLTENIYEVTRTILKLSKSENISTVKAANKIAEKRIADIKKVKSSY
ncbi:Glu/Leu/Phe/Val family dehydrogenase [Mucilaginibacter lappiensis]|uniref:Leucine dehydrogenase n=1 Tax=Mucilaginibacter lappiensis TaxID=354630 RepID=A0A1N7FLX5_9SPHI|nr:Glu/Leu/Phe/Val dehydrogenase [Mucilaginibacter lappiensis]MBB6112375.1 leucine dehydrogenase [Mucilaginibacter lappiensis]MBB6127107.1 leucine dehydrogenase [Mucilaginibacter lappiensis]SIS01246.1 leucine dehydrogenase [Mucilaginibacter lappiensis]